MNENVLGSVDVSAALDALIAITEIRDPYTARHQAAVGDLAQRIGQHMGLDEDLVELVRLGGAVHDIGKAGVPLDILTYPGRLGPAQFEIVKCHAAVGASVLRRAHVPWPIAEVAEQHHERLDGSGYPHGLSGEQIILPARIVTVADVVDSVSTHRPYRAALGMDVARDIIVKGIGSDFDGDVVAACLEVMEFPAATQNL